MASQVSKLSVSFDDAVTAGVNAANAALERTAKAMEKLNVASEKEDAAARRVGKTHEAVARQTDGAALALARQETALRRYEASIEAVNRAEQKTGANIAELAKQRERLAVIRDREVAKAAEQGRALEASFSGTEQATTALTKSTGATTMAMRNLGIQSIDVFQQLASGAPIMMTLIQQGGQVGQMAAVTGTSLGTMAKEVGAMALRFAPWIAATGIVVGLGVAIYSVLQRSSELDSQQRALSIAIRGVGRDAELSSGQLQGYVTSLKQQGVAAADAVKAIAELSRNSGLSSGMIGRIAGVAPDAAAALGQGVPETMRILAEAAKGTNESVQKLDDAFNLLTATEAAQVRAMIEHGDKAGALETVFEKLEGRVRGLNEDALSPMDKAFRDLGNSWDEFMNRIARSEPVLRIMRGAAELLRDTNQSDIAARMADTQGEIAEQRRLIERYGTGVGVARQEQVARSQARVAELESTLRRLQAQSEAMLPRTAQATPGAMAAPVDAAARELDRTAASRAAGSDAGRMAALTREAERYRTALSQLAPGTAEYAARAGTLNAALAATNKEIEDLNKKGETHRTGLEKSLDTYVAQTRAAEELTRAYSVSREEVARVLATRDAEQKAISEGLTPGTVKYASAVRSATEAILEKQKAEAGAKIAEQIRDANELTDSTNRMIAAYDGTEESIRRVREEEAARAAVLKSGLTPEMAGYTEAVDNLAEAYGRTSDASQALAHMQSSVSSTLELFGNAARQVGQGLVNATLSGARGFANMANVARAAFLSIAAGVAELALINPTINFLTGSRKDTIFAAAGALAGGGSSSGSGGILSGVGNVLSLGKISDAFGLTNFGGQLSSFGQSIGLTGPNGLFSGVSSSISGFLNTPVFGTLNPGTAWLESMGITAGMPGTGPASIGGLLGGFGLGFGAGSLGGGLLQSALGKTGPGPTIGSGIGAGIGSVVGSFIPGVGTVLGGLIGGLLGGAGGGLIGPGKKTLFSATGLTLDDSGMLGVGQTFSQLANTAEEVAALQQQVQQINALLSSAGARVTNTTSMDEYGQRRINDANTNTWINVGQGGGRSQELSFGALRFGANDPYINTALSTRSFANAEELAGALAEFTTFLNDTAPALKLLSTGDASYGIGSLATSVQALTEQFDTAKMTADKLGWSEYDLIEARQKSIQVANDNVAAIVHEADRSLMARKMMAEGVWSGDIQKQLDAVLWDFDAETKSQQKARKENLLTIFGDAFEATDAFAKQMLLLEETRGAERLATAKSYLEAINAAATQQAQQMQQASGTAANIVQGITGYVRGLTFANDNPLTSQQRYSSAASLFQQTLSSAMGGDATALSGLTNAAETFRLQSRGMYGSGAQYVTDFQSILAGLQNVALSSAESLTNTVYLSGVQTQTQTLVNSLAELKAEVASLKSALILATTNGPPSARAA